MRKPTYANVLDLDNRLEVVWVVAGIVLMAGLYMGVW